MIHVMPSKIEKSMAQLYKNDLHTVAIEFERRLERSG